MRGLSAADFSIFEDDARKPVAQFSAERVPVSVAIVLDVSGSMSTEPHRWDLTRRSVASFLSRLEKEDEVTLVAFNARPQRLGGWTRHTFDVFNELGRASIGGTTALFRALLAAVPPFGDAAHARKVLLLISDGNDHDLDITNPSLTSWRIRAIDAIRRSGVALYAIGIGMGHEPVDHRTLGELAEPTGGYVEVVSNERVLEGAVARVADDLRAQYTLSFEPTKLDGKFHEIIVRTPAREHRIRARAGYFAAQ